VRVEVERWERGLALLAEGIEELRRAVVVER